MKLSTVVGFLCLVPALAWAHPGHGGPAHAVDHGLSSVAFLGVIFVVVWALGKVGR